MEHEEYCARAARLLYKGLHPRLHPQQDREYSELVRTWLADHRLRQTLEGVATGLELVVVDVSEQGLVLAPRTPESRFAMSLTDYRQSLAGDTQRLSRGALALVQIGIAATFFPTADRLDDLEGYEGESIRLQDIREVVIALCQRLAQARAEDPQAVPELLRPGWEYLSNLPVSLPEVQRASLSSLEGCIQIVLSHLKDEGLVQFEETAEGGFYFANRRYQVLLRRRAAGGLFDLCHRLAGQEIAP